MWEFTFWVTVLGLLGLVGWFLTNLVASLSVWIDTKLNSEPVKPEPLTRSVVNGSIYLRRGDKVLDVGRGVRLSLSNGLEDEPNQEVLTWEGRRRIVSSSPPISMSMQILRKALGAGDDPGPALPMAQGQSRWLPNWSDEDE